jgi:hypothetical protein
MQGIKKMTAATSTRKIGWMYKHSMIDIQNVGFGTMKIDLTVQNKENGKTERVLLYPDSGYYLIVNLDCEESTRIDERIKPDILESQLKALQHRQISIERTTFNGEWMCDIIEGELIDFSMDFTDNIFLEDTV